MLRKNGKGEKKKSPRNTLAHKCRVFVKVQGLSQAERSLLLVTPQLLLHVILMSSFHWLSVKSCLVFTHFDLSRAIGPRQRPWRRHFNLRPPPARERTPPFPADARPLSCAASTASRSVQECADSSRTATSSVFPDWKQVFTPVHQLAEGSAEFKSSR